jgi:hypothetical protein
MAPIFHFSLNQDKGCIPADPCVEGPYCQIQFSGARGSPERCFTSRRGGLGVNTALAPFVVDIDFFLFEEALEEILLEVFPGRLRFDFDEGKTYRLHQWAAQKVHDKKAGLSSSKVLDDYNKSLAAEVAP